MSPVTRSISPWSSLLSYNGMIFRGCLSRSWCWVFPGLPCVPSDWPPYFQWSRKSINQRIHIVFRKDPPFFLPVFPSAYCFSPFHSWVLFRWFSDNTVPFKQVSKSWQWSVYADVPPDAALGSQHIIFLDRPDWRRSVIVELGHVWGRVLVCVAWARRGESHKLSSS